MLSSCSSAKDMTMVTSEPTSTATATASPNVTTILPGATNDLDSMNGMNGTDGMMDNRHPGIDRRDQHGQSPPRH